MLAYVYRYCNACGNHGAETFSESKYYINCSFNKTGYIAINYKTQICIGGVYEWEDTWSLYYENPHT